MGKPQRQPLEELKRLRRELKSHLDHIKMELREIGGGKESKYTTEDLNAVRKNLKMRLRGLNAAIRQQGMAKLSIAPIRRK